MKNLMKTFLVLTILFFVSCNPNGSTDTKESDNNSGDIDNFHQIDFELNDLNRVEDKLGQFVSVQKYAYKGTEIPVSAKFSKEIELVNFGFKHKQETSKVKPEGKRWSDKLTVSDDSFFDEYQIAVTGVPSDGGEPITLYTSVTVISEPNIVIHFDRKTVDESQVVTIESNKELDLVTLTDQDGVKREIQSNNSKLFQTSITLSSKNENPFVLDIFDKYGYHKKAELQAQNSSDVMAYTLFNGNPIHLVSYNLNQDENLFEEARYHISDVDENYYNSVMNHPNALPYEPFIYSMAISPDRKWVICDYQRQIKFGYESLEGNETLDPNKLFVDGNDKVIYIMFNHFVIKNTETNNEYCLGTTYKKSLIQSSKDYEWAQYNDQVIKEEGKWYYPLKWTDDGNLYLLEQTKEDKYFRRGQEESFPGLGHRGLESPYASANIIKLSLDTMEMEETNYQPSSPWVSYADHKTGLVCYASPNKRPIGYSDWNLPTHTPRPEQTMWISNLEGDKTYYIPDILSLNNITNPKAFVVYTSGIFNGKLYAICSVTKEIDRKKTENSYPESVDEYESLDLAKDHITGHAVEIYALEMETGIFKKISGVEDSIIIDSNKGYFSSFVDDKIYLSIMKRKGNWVEYYQEEEYSYGHAAIDENLEISVISESEERPLHHPSFFDME